MGIEQPTFGIVQCACKVHLESCRLDGLVLITSNLWISLVVYDISCDKFVCLLQKKVLQNVICATNSFLPGYNCFSNSKNEIALASLGDLIWIWKMEERKSGGSRFPLIQFKTKLDLFLRDNSVLLTFSSLFVDTKNFTFLIALQKRCGVGYTNSFYYFLLHLFI